MNPSQDKPQNSWSRRRAAVQAEAEADTLATEQAVVAKERAELSRKSDEEILEQLNLQDPDQMKPGDDFAAFMKAEVPQRLRRRALRTLWRSNPVLACLDDLVEYNEDFKAEWTVGGVVSTTYQVGKGMLAHVQEMERQKLAKEQAETDSLEPIVEDQAETPEVVVDSAVDDPSDTPAIVEPASEPDTDQQPELSFDPNDEPAHFTALRRMRFEFEEAQG